MDERDERKRTSGDASKRFRRHHSRSGSRTELENLSGDAKGKGTSSETARPKVPMRRAGADCSVIARKRGMPVERRGQVTDVGSEPTGNRRSSNFSTGGGSLRSVARA